MHFYVSSATFELERMINGTAGNTSLEINSIRPNALFISTELDEVGELTKWQWSSGWGYSVRGMVTLQSHNFIINSPIRSNKYFNVTHQTGGGGLLASPSSTFLYALPLLLLPCPSVLSERGSCTQ